jgi:hypothetical protein
MLLLLLLLLLMLSFLQDYNEAFGMCCGFPIEGEVTDSSSMRHCSREHYYCGCSALASACPSCYNCNNAKQSTHRAQVAIWVPMLMHMVICCRRRCCCCCRPYRRFPAAGCQQRHQRWQRHLCCWLALQHMPGQGPLQGGPIGRHQPVVQEAVAGKNYLFDDSEFFGVGLWGCYTLLTSGTLHHVPPGGSGMCFGIIFNTWGLRASSLQTVGGANWTHWTASASGTGGCGRCGLHAYAWLNAS